MKHRHMIDIHPANSAGYSLIDHQLAPEHAMRYHLTVLNETGNDTGWQQLNDAIDDLVQYATLKPFLGFRVLLHTSFDTSRVIACLNRKTLPFNVILPYGLSHESESNRILIDADQSFEQLEQHGFNRYSDIILTPNFNTALELKSHGYCSTTTEADQSVSGIARLRSYHNANVLMTRYTLSQTEKEMANVYGLTVINWSSELDILPRLFRLGIPAS